MTIYLDVILLENLVMNYIILYATGIINKLNLSKIRLLIASLLGSIYAVIVYMNILDIYSNIVFKIILSIVIIYIALNPKNLKTMLKQLLIFYLTSFVFGGCAFFLLYFIKPEDILIRNGIYIGSYPIKIVLLGGIVGYIVLTLAFKIVKNRISRKDMFCKIKIYFQGKSIDVNALIDTGNMLKDPITAVPVIVVEKERLEKIIPLEILENLEQIIQGNSENLIEDESLSKYISKFKIIPFKSLGKENGLLLGIKADYIELNLEEQIKKVDNVIIGIYDKKLSKNNQYQALIGLEILERSENINANEFITSIKE